MWLSSDENPNTLTLESYFRVRIERFARRLGPVIELASLGVATGGEIDGGEWIFVYGIAGDPVDVHCRSYRPGVRVFEARPRRLIIKQGTVASGQIDWLKPDCRGLATSCRAKI